MKNFILLIILTAIYSCNQPAAIPKETPVAVQEKILPPEDTVITRLRPVLLSIQTKELQQAGIIKRIAIDSVQYKMISMKDFFLIKKKELNDVLHFSTDKEKTMRALAYLDKMAAKASSAPKVYQAIFHLNALLGTTIVYNESHTKFLDEKFAEIPLIFP